MPPDDLGTLRLFYFVIGVIAGILAMVSMRALLAMTRDGDDSTGF
jgi:hypothetical protein